MCLSVNFTSKFERNQKPLHFCGPRYLALYKSSRRTQSQRGSCCDSAGTCAAEKTHFRCASVTESLKCQQSQSLSAALPCAKLNNVVLPISDLNFSIRSFLFLAKNVLIFSNSLVVSHKPSGEGLIDSELLPSVTRPNVQFHSVVSSSPSRLTSIKSNKSLTTGNVGGLSLATSYTELTRVLNSLNARVPLFSVSN